MNAKRWTFIFVVGIVWVTVSLAGRVIGAEIYQDPGASDESRARDVIAQLTLDEKLTLTSGGEGGTCLPGIPSLGLPAARMADASQGIRLETIEKTKNASSKKNQVQGLGGDKLVSVSFPACCRWRGHGIQDLPVSSAKPFASNP
ncbi:MAG: hypothetical protein WCK57_01920 [Verrucomicrobiae bacterium]